MSAMPSKWNIRRSSSSWSFFASFFGICSNWPSCCILRSSCRRSMRFLTVLKLVSMPPIHRRLTKYMPQRAASVWIVSCACFLVPTKSTGRPLAATLRVKSQASSSRRTVFCRSMMWMPLRAVKMYGRIFGFQRLVWCPKWTPASSSCFRVTCGTRNYLPVLYLRPTRALGHRETPGVRAQPVGLASGLYPGRFLANRSPSVAALRRHLPDKPGRRLLGAADLQGEVYAVVEAPVGLARPDLVQQVLELALQVRDCVRTPGMRPARCGLRSFDRWDHL